MLVIDELFHQILTLKVRQGNEQLSVHSIHLSEHHYTPAK